MFRWVQAASDGPRRLHRGLPGARVVSGPLAGAVEPRRHRPLALRPRRPAGGRPRGKVRPIYVLFLGLPYALRLLVESEVLGSGLLKFAAWLCMCCTILSF